MLRTGKNDAEKVGWGSKLSQEKRFRVLTEIGITDRNSVLDIGCGLGAYVNYFENLKINLKYTGLDINPKMIEGAKKKYPKIEFILGDVFSIKDKINDRSFDYIILSGALNLRADNQFKKIERTMFELFKIAKKGIALNFLSMFAENILANEYYCNPVDILKIAFTISRKVTLRHEYMPHDFTVYLLK